MTEVFADGVILPMIVLLTLGWSVPQVLARVMPEGVRALFALAIIAFGILLVLSAAFFASLYAGRGAPLSAFTPYQAALHFGRLGLLSAILWLPLMILSVSNLPRRWIKETW